MVQFFVWHLTSGKCSEVGLNFGLLIFVFSMNPQL